MSSLPSDDDANTRRVDTKPVAVSKIPRSDHHSPILVDASGSPRVSTISPATKYVALPTVSSKLPRKSQAPSQPSSLRSIKNRSSLVHQQSSIPTRSARTSLAMNTPEPSDDTKLTPPSSLDKPLPSPPFAQVIDPSSAPEAQRTLVDAESGSLSNTDWPILRPEDVSSQGEDTNTDLKANQQQQHQQQHPRHQQPYRSVSAGAVTRRNSSPYFVNRNFRSTAAASILAAQSVPEQANPRRPQSQQITHARTLGSRNPYGSSFHAISTGTDMAMESPLARKIGAPIALTVPPRHSLKRISLPLSSQALSIMSSTPPSPEILRMGLRDTSSPVLENKKLLEEPAQDMNLVFASLPDAQSLVAANTSSRNGSSGILSANSVVREGLELCPSSGTRIKHMNWCSPDIGPLLTIYPDAEAVLRGPMDEVPRIPSPVMLNRPPGGLLRERSFSALEDRFSQLAKPRQPSCDLMGSTIRNSVDVGPVVTTPVRIFPIRSMQPTRRANLGDFTPTSSPSTPSPIKSSRRHVNTLNMFMSPSDIAFEPFYRRQSASPDQADSTMDPVLASNISQVVGLLPGDAQRGPVNCAPPSFALSNLGAANDGQSKTSPSISSEYPLSSRNATVKSSMSGSSSSMAARTGPSQETTRSHGPSKLRATESTTPVAGDSIPTRTTRLSKSQAFTRHPGSVAFVSPVDRKVHEPAEKKVKIKRSLRDIFLKRDNKQVERPQPILEHKRSFMTETRSTLAKRLRETRSLSKIHLPRAQESKSSLRSARQPSFATAKLGSDAASRDANREAALSALEAPASSPTRNGTDYNQYETGMALDRIMNSITKMPADAPDRLGGLEIAEVVLNSVECYKMAQLSAAKADKYAREAELYAKQATIQINRLLGICKHRFDDDTLESISGMITSASLVGKDVESAEDAHHDA